jgi:hypothetical protein
LNSNTTDTVKTVGESFDKVFGGTTADIQPVQHEPAKDPHANEPVLVIQVSIPQSKVDSFKLFLQSNFNCTMYEDTDDISIY